MADVGRIETIAIDGPAGSGKSTIGKNLAKRLDYFYFDSGIMYRAITAQALADRLDIEDERRITELAEAMKIDVRRASLADGREADIIANGVDITWSIRTPEVDAAVSTVAAYPGVRQTVKEQLRTIAAGGKIVMVGRDIGTVVLPSADLKIYLEASPEERARRRYKERIERGEEADYRDILVSLRKRDRLDSSRKTVPLRCAPDAHIINSDDLSISEVLEHAMALVRRARSQV